MFYKIYKNKSPFYLFNLIPEKTSSYATRNVDCIPLIKIKHNFFRNNFFPPSAIIDWNKLDSPTQSSESFQKHYLQMYLYPPQEVFLIVTTTKELD